MRYKNVEERYNDLTRAQVRAISSFIENEKEKAEFLLENSRTQNRDLDNSVYRAAAYFINGEYNRKSGSLVLLIETADALLSELPKITRENFFDVLLYRFRAFGLALEKGGFS